MPKVFMLISLGTILFLIISALIKDTRSHHITVIGRRLFPRTQRHKALFHGRNASQTLDYPWISACQIWRVVPMDQKSSRCCIVRGSFTDHWGRSYWKINIWHMLPNRIWPHQSPGWPRSWFPKQRHQRRHSEKLQKRCQRQHFRNKIEHRRRESLVSAHWVSSRVPTPAELLWLLKLTALDSCCCKTNSI